jgi:hypothetical protein
MELATAAAKLHGSIASAGVTYLAVLRGAVPKTLSLVIARSEATKFSRVGKSYCVIIFVVCMLRRCCRNRDIAAEF